MAMVISSLAVYLLQKYICEDNRNMNPSKCRQLIYFPKAMRKWLVTRFHDKWGSSYGKLLISTIKAANRRLETKQHRVENIHFACKTPYILFVNSRLSVVFPLPIRLTQVQRLDPFDCYKSRLEPMAPASTVSDPVVPISVVLLSAMVSWVLLPIAASWAIDNIISNYANSKRRR